MNAAPREDNAADPSASAASHVAATHRVSSALARFQRGPFLTAVPSFEVADPLDPIPPEHLLKKALSSLALTRMERVLELGSTTGYETALLSHFAIEVFSLVPHVEVAAARTELLSSLGCHNVHVVVGPSEAGWPAAAPYAAVLVASGATQVPPALFDQLELNGRLVIPLGDDHGQLLELVQRRHDGFFSETLASCRLPMLPGASRRPSSFPWGRDG